MVPIRKVIASAQSRTPWDFIWSDVHPLARLCVAIGLR